MTAFGRAIDWLINVPFGPRWPLINGLAQGALVTVLYGLVIRMLGS